MTEAGGAAGERVDLWLWHARACRSRSLAQALAESGRLRLNGTPVTKAHQKLRVGDVLTFAQGAHIRVWRVLALSERRLGAGLVGSLYEDLKPPTTENRLERSEPSPRPERRPDKRARRALAQKRRPF
ncbi:MAG TPA: S4 domain-containing protein [Kiloniellales bacterium]|nr:S4 domain-containing protein [Kiloniellales bacterium]